MMIQGYLFLKLGLEMPPQDVVNASQQLKDLVLQLLNKQRLNHGELQALGTPRRLVVCVESLCKKQTENEVEVRGPPVSKAFDQQGNPTKAAEGFCRKYDVPLDSLFKKVDGKTEYIYAQVKESARLALEVDKGISPEVVRAVLAERANFPCLAAKTANEMEALSRGELFLKVVEAYSRPTRIVRGKDVDRAVEVDESAFETAEERALWSAFLSVNNKIHPGIEVDDFVEISALLVQPLEDFFNHVFVMVEEERIRKNRLVMLKKIADLPRGIADLSVLPGF